MITGTSQADAAVLLCAANDGVNAQTKEHAFLARVLGVKQLIVNVNKMDISGVDYSEDKYKQVCEEVDGLLKMAGFNPADVPKIPCSSFNGENLYNVSENMGWWKGTTFNGKDVKTIFEAIDAVQQPSKPVDKPLRLPIQDVYKISGIGTVPVGKIETGILNVGKNVVFNPSQKSAEVKSIEMHTRKLQRQSLVTTSVSTFVVLQQLTSAVVTLLDTQTVSQPSSAMTRHSSDRFS